MNFSDARRIKTGSKVDHYCNTNTNYKIHKNYTNASYQMASPANLRDRL